MKFLFLSRAIAAKSALLFCLLLFECGPAIPTKDDLPRIKDYFLQLRFNAALISGLEDKNDRELFEMSCQANRTNCSRSLELLKKEDPQFYKKLMAK